MTSKLKSSVPYLILLLIFFGIPIGCATITHSYQKQFEYQCSARGGETVHVF